MSDESSRTTKRTINGPDIVQQLRGREWRDNGVLTRAADEIEHLREQVTILATELAEERTLTQSLQAGEKPAGGIIG